MTLTVFFNPLQLVPKEFMVGDTIRVTASFRYIVGEQTTITIRAVPYNRILGILNRIGSSAGYTYLTLEKAVEPKDVETTIDFTLQNMSSGTYGLLVEILNTDYYVMAESVLIVTAPIIDGGNIITQFMPMMMMVMMMGLVMPMMAEE